MKPPVEAPASRARRPATATPNWSSAASSLRPPRPTNGDGGPSTTTGSPGATRRAALSACVPETRTVAGGDRRLGLLPGVDEAASHELGIEPAAGPAGQLAAFFLWLPEPVRARRPSCVDGSSWRPSWCDPWRPAGGLMPGRRDLGRPMWPSSRARVAVLPAWVVTSLAVFPAWAVTPLAVWPALLVASLAALPARARPARSRPWWRCGRPWPTSSGPRPPGWRSTPTTGDRSSRAGGHLVAHQFEHLLAGLVAPFDQVVDPLLCLAALDVSGVHQLSHDLLGPATADLSEDGSRIEVLAYALITCHFTRVSGVLAAGKHFQAGLWPGPGRRAGGGQVPPQPGRHRWGPLPSS